MKKLLIAFALVLSLASLQAGSFSVSSVQTTQSIESLDCKYGQCYATAKSTGQRCKHCVSKSGDSYCWQHK
jgi:hypothetical protein